MNKIFWILIATWASGFIACESDPECTPLESRCHNETVQLCSPSGFWQTIHECKVEGPSWMCHQPKDEEAECIRK